MLSSLNVSLDRFIHNIRIWITGFVYSMEIWRYEIAKNARCNMERNIIHDKCNVVYNISLLKLSSTSSYSQKNIEMHKNPIVLSLNYSLVINFKAPINKEIILLFTIMLINRTIL